MVGMTDEVKVCFKPPEKTNSHFKNLVGLLYQVQTIILYNIKIPENHHHT